jgi:hypothetical protein
VSVGSTNRCADIGPDPSSDSADSLANCSAIVSSIGTTNSGANGVTFGTANDVTDLTNGVAIRFTDCGTNNYTNGLSLHITECFADFRPD